uniref:Uncharacterized protein n=1 Tax=Meloidogyne incognita TaxID=6306 RepID=A0A914KMI9_MELIC
MLISKISSCPFCFSFPAFCCPAVKIFVQFDVLCEEFSSEQNNKLLQSLLEGQMKQAQSTSRDASLVLHIGQEVPFLHAFCCLIDRCLLITNIIKNISINLLGFLMPVDGSPWDNEQSTENAIINTGQLLEVGKDVRLVIARRFPCQICSLRHLMSFTLGEKN